MATDPDRGEYRYVDVGRAHDPEFQSLSPATKLASVWIDLNLSRAGIGVIYPGVIETQTGITAEQLEQAYLELGRDSDQPWHVKREGNLVWVTHRLASDPGLTVRTPNHRRAVQIHLETLPQRAALTKEFREHYREWFKDGSSHPPPKRPDRSSRQVEDLRHALNEVAGTHEPTHDLTHAEPSAKGSGMVSPSAVHCGAVALHSGAEHPARARAPARARDRPHRTAPPSAHAEQRTATAADRPVAQWGLFRSAPGDEQDRPPPLPREAEQLLSAFYTPGDARYQDARAQLLASIRLPGGVKIDRTHGWVRGTPEQLAAACREIIADPPNVRQLAARFVLLRMQTRIASPAPVPPRRMVPDPAEAIAREVYREELAGWITVWREANPEQLRELEAECNQLLRGGPDVPLTRQAWLDGAVMERAKFPDFGSWYRERRGTVRTPAPAIAAARELRTVQGGGPS